jgi:antitoxin ParD1/3/4
MTDDADRAWPPKELREWANQQAQDVRQAATEGGLRFQAYLPPELALWLLDRIEQGMFLDPSEAVFVLLDEAREMEPNLDLRQELLKRRILSAADDPRPSIPADEFMAEFEAMRRRPQPKPAVWLPKQED